MTEPTIAEAAEPQLLPKLHETRQLVESARWSLLDVVIFLNEIEEDVLRAGRERLRAELLRLDLTGPNANRSEREAEAYEPDDREDWRPESDCG